MPAEPSPALTIYRTNLIIGRYWLFCRANIGGLNKIIGDFTCFDGQLKEIFQTISNHFPNCLVKNLIFPSQTFTFLNFPFLKKEPLVASHFSPAKYRRFGSKWASFKEMQELLCLILKFRGFHCYVSEVTFYYCHSPTQPQLKLLRHFQAT